jgi:hypothetical protein
MKRIPIEPFASTTHAIPATPLRTMATKEEKDAYKTNPKLLLEALNGAPGKNGPCPLTKAEAAFHVWNYSVAGMGTVLVGVVGSVCRV